MKTNQAAYPPSSSDSGFPGGCKEGGGSAASSYGRAFRNKWQGMTYKEKLACPEWKRFSHKIKEDADWHCEECGEEQGQPGINLEVHHVHYETGRLPWEYPRALVMALCGNCHHERQIVEQRFLSNVAELLRQKSIPEIQDQPMYAVFTPTEYEP
jgi:ribosomal protein L37AE/L43A